MLGSMLAYLGWLQVAWAGQAVALGSAGCGLARGEGMGLSHGHQGLDRRTAAVSRGFKV